MRTVLLYVSLFLTGCAASPSVWTKSFKYNALTEYPPTDHVEVVEGSQVRPHEILALLETRMHSQASVPELLESMREKAKELGADAIIEIEQDEVVSQQQLVRDVWWGGYQTVGGEPIPILRGKAIKYRKP